MAKAKTAWGIDIGQCALKALKLVDYADGSDPQVEAFEIIEHQQVLSSPDADRDQLIRQSLEELLARGYKVRIYVPYGESWYDYSLRRLKENPRIAAYVLKNLFR